MKVIIAGGRDFNNEEMALAFLNQLIKEGYLIESEIEVVCGEARGADTVGKSIAQGNNLPLHSFPAHWHKHGNSAGYIRNSEMANFADVLVAFWDGQSAGTKHMIDIMTAKDKPVHIQYY